MTVAATVTASPNFRTHTAMAPAVTATAVTGDWLKLSGAAQPDRPVFAMSQGVAKCR